MNIVPMNDRVLVAENKKENKTESGIVLSDGARGVGDTARATVLAIGKDVKDVKVGDVILLDWSKASPVKVGDAQRAMVKEEFIIGVFDE